MNNNQFYDLDYEKIGNIEEVSRSYSLKNGQNGAVIINKECSAGNKTEQLLYSLKNSLLFGVNSNKFHAENKGLKVYHHKNEEEVYEVTEEELMGYAEFLGIQLPEEEDLMWIAEEGICAELPEDWATE